MWGPEGFVMEDAQQMVRHVPVQITHRQAFIGIGVCALAQHGRIETRDVKLLPRLLSLLPPYRKATHEELEFTLSRVARIGQEGGVEELLQASVSAVPERLREAAFAFAVDVVMFHSIVGAQEQAFLERLRMDLSVEPSRASLILEVARIRHLV